MAFRGVLQGEGRCARGLCTRREALRQAADHQQDGSPNANLAVTGQEPDAKGRRAHDAQRDEEDLLPAQFVAEVAHDQAAYRPGNIGDSKGGERAYESHRRVGLQRRR